MAKVERVETDVICDRPGCGKRVTDKGSTMVVAGGLVSFMPPFSEIAPEIFAGKTDLCRECSAQVDGTWNRKAGNE